jgi:hypothetical protein
MGTREAYRLLEGALGRKLRQQERGYLGWSEPFHELAWRLSRGKHVALQEPDLVELRTVGDVERWLEEGLSVGRLPPPVELPKLSYGQRQAIHSYVRKLQRETGGTSA